MTDIEHHYDSKLQNLIVKFEVYVNSKEFVSKNKEDMIQSYKIQSYTIINLLNEFINESQEFKSYDLVKKYSKIKKEVLDYLNSPLKKLNIKL